MRIRTGHGPQDWHEEGPAVARFHGIAQWGTRGAAVVYGTNRPVPNVIRANLRTPETASSKAARIKRESARVRAGAVRVECGVYMAKVSEHCARAVGHKHQHKSRYALDNMAVSKRSAVA